MPHENFIQHDSLFSTLSVRSICIRRGRATPQVRNGARLGIYCTAFLESTSCLATFIFREEVHLRTSPCAICLQLGGLRILISFISQSTFILYLFPRGADSFLRDACLTFALEVLIPALRWILACVPEVLTPSLEHLLL